MIFRRPLGEVREKRPFTLHLYNRFVHKYFARDLNIELQARARSESADYVQRAMQDAVMFRSRWLLLRSALAEATVAGSFLEFGVEKGDSLNFCARILAATSKEIHGFDSFEGLPEEWTGTFEQAGKFSLGGKLPPVLPNAHLHQGWFAETLPRYLAGDPDPVSFVHIDCDIYSSTKTVLDALAGRLRSGSIVVFDEYFNYHGWQRHEFRAWQDFARASGLTYEYRGFCARGTQVYLKVI